MEGIRTSISLEKPSLDELMHVGVKGMHWGVRKKEETGDHVVAVRNVKKTPDVAKQVEIGKKRAEAAKPYYAKIDKAKADLEDVNKNGMNTPLAKMLYGPHAATAKYVIAANGDIISSAEGITQMKAGLNKRIRINEDAAKAKLEGRMTNGQKIALGVAITVGVLGTAYIVANRKDLISKMAKAGEQITHKEFFNRFVASDFDQNFRGKRDLSKLGTEDFILPKGSILKRISGDPEKVLRDGMYVAFSDEDVNRYKAILPKYFSWIKPTSTYEIEMKALTDIKSPSSKKRVEVFIEMLERDRQKFPEGLRAFGLDDKSDLVAAGERFYQQFAGVSAGKSLMGKEYFNRLTELGYNAWIDDNDRGKLSDTPLVLLKAKAVERLGAQKMTKEDLDNALNSLVELKARNRRD